MKKKKVNSNRCPFPVPFQISSQKTQFICPLSHHLSYVWEKNKRRRRIVKGEERERN